MSAVVGVDIGTTSAKAAAFEPDGTMHAVAERAYELREPHPGWAVQDPAAVLDAAQAVLEEAVAGTPDVAGVACSTAMHGLVGLGSDGRPVTDLVTWADARALEQAERLRQERPELHHRTGTPLHPMSPLPKLVWFRECEPDTFAAAERWCGMKELLLERLAGSWVVDRSTASAMGLMDLRTGAWDPEALEVAGVRAGQLPEIVEVDAVLDGWKLPLVAGGADGPLANLGVGAVRPGVAACSIGTSGALRVVVEEPQVDEQGRTFCFALAPGRWTVGGSINNGGVVLQWAGEALAPDLGEHAEAELLELAAGVPPGSDGLVMLPYLLSERAPHWSAVPRGAYVGLTRAHGRGPEQVAAVEGVCQQLALVLASVRDAGYDVHEVRATGGFARSPFWRQLLADVLGMAVGFPESEQGSAFGAALVGMQALGLVDSIDVAADLVRVEQVLEPDPEAAAAYERLLPVFASLYDALRPAFLALREAGRPSEQQSEAQQSEAQQSEAQE